MEADESPKGRCVEALDCVADVDRTGRRISTTILRWGSALIILAVAVWFLLIPGGLLLSDFNDPHLRGPGIPRRALRVHQALTPRYERWARARVAGGDAAGLTMDSISGTEWPLFGSAFYLWATESLQQAWERDHTLCRIAPAEYARGAIEASAALVADPEHATWVRLHWGPEYLHDENVFYRMLLIGGLTSHYNLTRQDTFLPLLRDQVETLSRALDESAYGLLDDYPGQCYPTDVLAAIACIRRADAVLGTDHSAFVERSLRAFRGALLDATGLPPYAADARCGECLGPARGCGNSFMLTWSPELWPETGRAWYKNYETHFWQSRWGAVCFREFPAGVPRGDWYIDVDAGPVLAGHGFAAGAFGVGAARANGRFDHAYPLSVEMLVAAWPMADGTLLVPRLLSDATDAPYLGEAAILFTLTRQPADGVEIRNGSDLPAFAIVVLVAYWVFGLLLIYAATRRIGVFRRRGRGASVPRAQLQLVAWIVLCIAALAIAYFWSPFVGGMLLLFVQVLPHEARRASAGRGAPSFQGRGTDRRRDTL